MENNLPSVEDAIHSYKKFYFFEAFTDNELYHLKKLMQEYASLLVAQRDKRIDHLEGLVARMYNEFIRAAENTSPAVSENNWQQFKNKHNL